MHNVCSHLNKGNDILTKHALLLFLSPPFPLYFLGFLLGKCLLERVSHVSLTWWSHEYRRYLIPNVWLLLIYFYQPAFFYTQHDDRQQPCMTLRIVNVLSRIWFGLMGVIWFHFFLNSNTAAKIFCIPSLSAAVCFCNSFWSRICEKNSSGSIWGGEIEAAASVPGGDWAAEVSVRGAAGAADCTAEGRLCWKCTSECVLLKKSNWCKIFVLQPLKWQSEWDLSHASQS